jgi:translation elongation factor EF-Ts
MEQMGFSHIDSRRALHATNGNIQQAIELLTSTNSNKNS